MNYRIAIVNSSSFGKIFKEHLERLKKIGQVDFFDFASEIDGVSLAEALHGYNVIISSVTPFFRKDFFENKDELLLISRHGIGYNNVDLDAARDHGTIVTIVPALVERDAVAENNLTNLLAVMRQTVSSNERVHLEKWQDRAQFVGHGLSGKTVGIIGVGNIGSRIAEIVNYGFLCEVLCFDPNKSHLEIAQYGGTKVDLKTLLKKSDVICLAASLNDDSYHMLSFSEFEQMKSDVYLSNAARGALVDEEAMVSALKSGKVAGYATDVLEVEPPEKNHPFLQFSNVIVTPHTSAYTMECLHGMGERCVDDVEAVVVGRLPERAVQPISQIIH